jgi:hypothetical protein
MGRLVDKRMEKPENDLISKLAVEQVHSRMITPPAQSPPIDEWFDIDAYEPGIQPASQL